MSDLFGNPEDRFSSDVAHIFTIELLHWKKMVYHKSSKFSETKNISLITVKLKKVRLTETKQAAS